MRIRRFFTVVVLLVAVCLWVTPASANSWGLSRGRLLDAVMKDSTWNSYSRIGNESGPFAVMSSRYHNALFFADGQGTLHVYTEAVYQPDDKKKAPSLEWDGLYLSISYGDDEYYLFCDYDWTGEYRLCEAVIGDFYLYAPAGDDAADRSCETSELGDSADWPVRITLSDFNIRLFPRSVREVRELNAMRAQLGSSLQCLGSPAGTSDPYGADQPGQLLQPKKKGTAAVYTAPYGKSAWRAGKGKAAVGLNGDIWVLSYYLNEDGDSYACIRYNVSERTQRIGYALCSGLGLPEVTDWHPDEPSKGLAHVEVTAVADTFLTDDPDVGQYPQFTVPRGTRLTCMGLYNDYYAYVAAEAKDGKLAEGGAVVWGFVPVRDLAPVPGENAADAAERLVGNWKCTGGGTMADDFLVFYADGTFTAGTWDWDLDTPERIAAAAEMSGTWAVTVYDPARNLFWDRPPYQLTLTYNSGWVTVLGLDFDGAGFSLTDAEGGGGYEPATDEEVRLTEDHG